MTKVVLCERCGVHEVQPESEICRFCLGEEEDYIEAEMDVEKQMRRSEGRRIAEGFMIIEGD